MNKLCAAEPEACSPSEVSVPAGFQPPHFPPSCRLTSAVMTLFLLPDLKPNFSGPPPSSMAAGPDPAYLQGNIRMTLEDPDLWKTFHGIGTEMIITKPGR